MDTTYRKGQECLFKPMLCQEGYCIDCQIAIDTGNQAQGTSLQTNGVPDLKYSEEAKDTEIDNYCLLADVECIPKLSAYNKGKQVGMKKVVGYIETTYIAPLTQNGGLVQIRDLEADLKIKSKEWGL